MDNVKDDDYYLRKIIEHIDVIIQYSKGMSYLEFINDSKTLEATMFRFVQLGENISHLSKEFKQKYPHIKWGEIMGFRNGIVHDYGKTDYFIVYDIVTKDIYKLRESLGKNIVKNN